MANIFGGQAPVRFEYSVKDVVQKEPIPPKSTEKKRTSKIGKVGVALGKTPSKPKLNSPSATKRTRFRGQVAGQHLKASVDGNVNDSGPDGLTKDNPNIVSFSKFVPPETKTKEKPKEKPVVLEEPSIEPGS